MVAPHPRILQETFPLSQTVTTLLQALARKIQAPGHRGIGGMGQKFAEILKPLSFTLSSKCLLGSWANLAPKTQFLGRAAPGSVPGQMFICRVCSVTADIEWLFSILRTCLSLLQTECFLLSDEDYTLCSFLLWLSVSLGSVMIWFSLRRYIFLPQFLFFQGFNGYLKCYCIFRFH